MTARRVTQVVNAQGIHARPSTRLVEIANRHKSKVEIQAGGTVANAKSVLSILALCAPVGTELVIVADGEDEQAAVDALVAEVERGFGE